MNTTGERVLAALRVYDLADEGNGHYRANSPLRPQSNSHAFTLTIHDDGEHGAYTDHVTDEHGTLYQLADILKVKRPTNAAEPEDTKRAYSGLTDYAEAHGVTAEVFAAAGWQERVTYQQRPALPFTTATGRRYRFIDGEKPVFKPAEKGYSPCWYGLKRALKIVADTGQPLVICNGEPSTVVAQHFGVAAIAHTAGENKIPPRHLIDELRAAYTGPILIALDCDEAGRAGAAKGRGALRSVGYDVRAVDLNGGKGFDLADFARLHGTRTADALQALNDLIMDNATATMPAVVSAKTLFSKELPPVRLVVPPFLPEGSSLLAGKAKLGKSWLALGLSLAVASGGYALGKIPVERGSVLHLALEDNERRLQSRLRKLIGNGPVPDNLEFATAWPRFGEGGIRAIEAWLVAHPDARLVVVDTLDMVFLVKSQLRVIWR